MPRITCEAGDLAATLAGLETQDVGTLRSTWQRLYRASPPDRISRDDIHPPTTDPTSDRM